MSRYHHSATNNAGWEAFNPELAPCLPTMDQGGTCNRYDQAGTSKLVGSKAALPPKADSVSLHARAGATRYNYPEGPRQHDDKGHTCTSCRTSFRNNSQLEQHAAKNKHKAYLCTCRKAFTKLSALRRHFEESTQAREHQCPLCDNEFKRPGHVEQHLRLVHKKPNDVIKDLLSAQKSQPPQEPRQASTASSAAPTTGYVDSQADYPIAIPGGHWTGPIDFSATAPVDHPGSRPVYSSAFLDFLAPGPGYKTGAPAFAPQSFMTHTWDHSPYSAYPTGAGAAQTGFPASPAPDFVGWPAAPLDGHLDLSNVDLGSLFVNLDDGLEMPALENDLTWEPFGTDFNTFGF